MRYTFALYSSTDRRTGRCGDLAIDSFAALLMAASSQGITIKARKEGKRKGEKTRELVKRKELVEAGGRITGSQQRVLE